MAVVPLRFPPPEEPDIVALHVYEGGSPEGPFQDMIRTTAVGTYPDYIDHYNFAAALSEYDWFAIQWENVAGALSPLSEAVQGGMVTLVGEIVQRVMRRDSTLDEAVVAEEAEAVIESVFGANPPSVYAVSKNKLSAMTLLTMVRVQIGNLARSDSSVSSWTAGLVSMKSESGSSVNINLLRDLMKEAQRALGFSSSRVAQIVMPEIAQGLTEVVSADISRLLIEVE